MRSQSPSHVVSPDETLDLRLSPAPPVRDPNYKLDRRFRGHIPGSKGGGVRVDIDNDGEEPEAHPLASKANLDNLTHPTEWVTRLYLGSGKSYEVIVPTIEDTINLLISFTTSPEWVDRISRFLDDLDSLLRVSVPDATTLQASWAKRTSDSQLGPLCLLEGLSSLVETHFPAEQFNTKSMPRIGYLPGVTRRSFDVKTAAFLTAARFSTEATNRGTYWMLNNREQLYWPDEWPEMDIEALDDLEPRTPEVRNLLKERLTTVGPLRGFGTSPQ